MTVNVWLVTKLFNLRRDETEGITEMKGILGMFSLGDGVERTTVCN
jgi:hypothetical protein